MTNSARLAWALVAVVGTTGAALLATNRGFYNHDELDLSRQIAGADWFHWSFLLDGGQLFYRPLGYALFRAQLGIAGGDPVAVHTLSALHHAINVGLLGWLLSRVSLPPRLALIALAIPLSVPGQAWVAAVYDRLALSFVGVAALLLSVRGPLCLLGIVGWLGALLSKESVVGFAAPAALLAWRWRRDPDRRPAAAAAGVAVAIAIAFAAWRMASVQAPDAYAAASVGQAGAALLRHAAFPFALGAEDPRTVWGWRWLGLLGSLAVAAFAWCGARRLALFGAVTAVAPVLPAVLRSRLEGHCLYLSLPGALLLVAAAARCRHPVARWSLAVLLAIAWLQTGLLVRFYRSAGDTMTRLQQAHAAAHADAEFVVAPPSGALRTIVDRFVLHAQHCGLSPPPALTGRRDAPGVFVVGDDGQVRRNPP